MIAAGWLMLLLGLAGLVLPFLPGWLFIIAGLLLLSGEYVWAHRLLETARRRFPRIAARVDSATQGIITRLRIAD